MAVTRATARAPSASQIHCIPDRAACAVTIEVSWMVAVAVAVVNPLTRVTVARQEPWGRLFGAAKVMFHDCPGARVTIRWAGNGPELVPPGPSVRRALPFTSMARPPVLFTWATTMG